MPTKKTESKPEAPELKPDEVKPEAKPDESGSDDELTFTPVVVEGFSRTTKPNPWQKAVNGLKIAEEGAKPEGFDVLVPAATKDGTVSGFLDRAQEVRNEANPDHPVTVRRKIMSTNEDGSRVYRIWVIDKIVRKASAKAAESKPEAPEVKPDAKPEGE